MAKKGAKASKGVINVDFSNVGEGGGKRTRVAPGDYAVKVVKVESKMSVKNQPYLNWELKGINGALKDKTLWYSTSLQEQALFNLRNVLLACKVSVAKAMKIDLKKLIGLVFGVTLEDDEYKGKVRSEVVDVFPVTVKKDGKMIKEIIKESLGDDDDEDDYEDLEDVDLDEDEDEDSDEEEDEEDEADEVDYSSMDKEELKALCKERKIKTKKEWKKKDFIAALEAADGEDEEDED